MSNNQNDEQPLSESGTPQNNPNRQSKPPEENGDESGKRSAPPLPSGTPALNEIQPISAGAPAITAHAIQTELLDKLQEAAENGNFTVIIFHEGPPDDEGKRTLYRYRKSHNFRVIKRRAEMLRMIAEDLNAVGESKGGGIRQ